MARVPPLALLLALLAGAAGGAGVLRWLQGAPPSEAPRERQSSLLLVEGLPRSAPRGRPHGCIWFYQIQCCRHGRAALLEGRGRGGVVPQHNQGALVVLDEVHRLPNPSEVLKIAADHFPTTRVLAAGRPRATCGP